MAKWKEIVGTGTTGREVTCYSGEDMADFWRQTVQTIRRQRRAGGGQFGAATLELRQWVDEVLSEAGPGPFVDDTLEAFAERIRQLHNITLAVIQRGNADGAARFGYMTGFLHCQVVMKFGGVETAALFGRKMIEGRRRRRRDALAVLIDEALSPDVLGKDAPAEAVLDWFRKLAKNGHPIIQDVEDDGTLWLTGKKRPTSYKTLQNRISARRKKTQN